MKNITLKLTFLLGLIVLSSSITQAQLNYQPTGFSTFIGTYTDLGSNGTAITMSNSDSGNSVPMPIGFTFMFNSVPYDSFVMYVDGIMKLGRDPISSANAMLFTAWNQPPQGGPFNNATSVGYNPTAGPQDTSLIVPFGMDMFGANGGLGLSDFRVQTTGIAGSRVCTIQWKNLSEKTQTLPVVGTTTTVLRQYDTINFQVKLYETLNVIEFVYGRWVASANPSQSRFAACGIKGNNATTPQLVTLTKASGTAWSVATPNSQSIGLPLGNYNTTTFNALNYGNGVRPAPEVGRTFRFGPVVFNDVAVNNVYAMGKVVLGAYTPDSIRAYITNPGVNAQTNVPVTLNITGANSFTSTVTIPSIASNGNAYVAFPPFTPTGFGQGLITVSVPNDDNNSNNTGTYGFSVSNSFMAYTDTTKPAGQGNGFTSPNFWGCRYNVVGSRMVTQVRAYLLSTSAAVGDTVCGMVIDTLGNILGRSPSYIVQNSDLGTFLTFNISIPPTVTNTSIIAGILGGFTIGGNYFLGSYQLENPIRPYNNCFYQILTTTHNLTSAAPGLFFGTPTLYSNGRLMMECTLDPLPAVDVGIQMAAPLATTNIPTGVSIPLRAVIKNFGTQTRPSGVQVWYRINNGTIIGPVSSTVSIVSNDTSSVYFTSANALNFATAGTYTVKIYTALSGDNMKFNDTLTLTYTAAPAATLPYRVAGNFLTTFTPQNNTSALIKAATVINPNGISTANTTLIDNFGVGFGQARLVTPPISFVGNTAPILHFSLAAAPHTLAGRDDTLQVLISTNGGFSYTTLYTRTAQSGSVPLGTVAASSTAYTPSSANDWRHEAIDLTAYANNPFVLIAYRAVSATGNNVYLANFSITNSNLISSQTVSAVGSYTSGAITALFPTNIGANNAAMTFARYAGPPSSLASPVYATNTTATTNNSNIFTPSNVSIGNWWTICYSGIGTGNLASNVQYYIQWNTTGYAGISQADNLYVMKRSEINGSWVALPTTRSSSVLVAGPITGFSDFAIGSQPLYNLLPVDFLGIDAKKQSSSQASVTWSTASEKNNDYFVIERSNGDMNFVELGRLQGKGNSNEVMKYEFIDNDYSDRVNAWYRIKQVDKDGAFSYSRIVVLEPLADLIEVFPNPFVNNFVVNAKGNHELTLFDITGKKVLSKSIDGQTSISLPPTTENGVYILEIRTGDDVKKIKLIRGLQ